MPALKKVITDNDYVRSIIARQKELLRLTDAQIAKKIGITRPTLQSRLREPEDFSLGELRELITVLKLTQEDGLTILMGRRVQAMNEDEELCIKSIADLARVGMGAPEYAEDPAGTMFEIMNLIVMKCNDFIKLLEKEKPPLDCGNPSGGKMI